MKKQSIIRQAILARLADEARPVKWLAVKAAEADVCSADMIYRWLRGQNEIAVSSAERVAELAGLTVSVGPGPINL